jgi:hypothetical protein
MDKQSGRGNGREVVLMVIFDEEDMKWAMSVFNVGTVVYPVPVEEDTNDTTTGDDAVETE